MLAGMGVKSRNLRDFWRIPAASFQKKDPKAILDQIAGERPAARAGADDNKVVVRGLLFWMKCGVVHCARCTTLPGQGWVSERFEQVN